MKMDLNNDNETTVSSTQGSSGLRETRERAPLGSTNRAIAPSPREGTVLHLIAWGYTNGEIAVRLGLSVKTVEAHKANGMRKLRVGRRAELVRYAVQSGWFSEEPPL